METLSVRDRLWMVRDDLTRRYPERFWIWAARHAPRSLRKWVAVTLFSDAWVRTNKEPNAIGYDDICTQLEIR
jgi:hypothetical protein